MKNRLEAVRFCNRCGVRIMKANRSNRLIGSCQVCTTIRGRREARRSESRLRVPVAGFLPTSFWK